MEKGSFQTSVRSVLETDEQVANVPIPNQMPIGLDLSKLPEVALRSSAVETLLGQNADLMARLGVALRKGGVLETRVTELQTENLHLRHRSETIKDQLLVLQEKERLLTERAAQVGAEAQAMQGRISALERRYADVYTHSQQQGRELRRLQNYRFRMKTVAENLRKQAARVFSVLTDTNEKKQTVGAALELAEQELQAIRSDNADAQLQLVNRYEGEITHLRTEMELLRRRAADRDMLYEAKVRIENQLIFEERQARQYRDDTQAEMQAIKEENLDLREQLKTRLIEIDRFEREVTVAIEKLEISETQDKDKTDQILSLQLLWKDKQAETERLEEKNRSLQKLNQQLSVSLNTQRREIMELKADIEKEKYLAQEKFKAIETQLEQSILVK